MKRKRNDRLSSISFSREGKLDLISRALHRRKFQSKLRTREIIIARHRSKKETITTRKFARFHLSPPLTTIRIPIIYRIYISKRKKRNSIQSPCPVINQRGGRIPSVHLLVRLRGSPLTIQDESAVPRAAGRGSAARLHDPEVLRPSFARETSLVP